MHTQWRWKTLCVLNTLYCSSIRYVSLRRGIAHRRYTFPFCPMTVSVLREGLKKILLSTLLYIPCSMADVEASCSYLRDETLLVSGATELVEPLHLPDVDQLVNERLSSRTVWFLVLYRKRDTINGDTSCRLVVIRHRTFGIPYRACSALHPLLSECLLCWHHNERKFARYQILVSNIEIVRIK